MPQYDSESDKDSTKADLARRRETFRANIHQLFQATALPLEAFSQRIGVDSQAVRRWLREGTTRAKYEHLAGIARVFGIPDPEVLFTHRLPSDLDLRLPTETESAPETTSSANVDQQTNPSVDELRLLRPELFREFTHDDWDELYSLHGIGGALTAEGALRAVEKINTKRELRRKFEALLETHHFATLASLIDMMYRDTEYRPHPPHDA